MAGAMLLRAGWDVRIYERVAGDIASRGAGIATHEKLFEAFRRAGAHIDDADRFCPHGPYRLRPQRRRDRSYASPPDSESLEHPLPAAAGNGAGGGYHLGKEVRRVQSTPGGAALEFADGTRAEGDLVIGADGIWSSVREQILPQSQPTYCGYVAWRGLLDENCFDADFGRHFASLQCLYAARGEQFIFYMLNGADDSLEEGRRRFDVPLVPRHRRSNGVARAADR